MSSTRRALQPDAKTRAYRGWTPEIMLELLGEPVIKSRRPRDPSIPKLPHYYRPKVRRAEASATFKVASTKRQPGGQLVVADEGGS